MKPTKWKVARVAINLPEKDRENLWEAFNTGEWDGELMSMFTKMHNSLSCNVKQRGAFGKRGTNRKEVRRDRMREMKRLLLAKENIQNITKDTSSYEPATTESKD